MGFFSLPASSTYHRFSNYVAGGGFVPTCDGEQGRMYYWLTHISPVPTSRIRKRSVRASRVSMYSCERTEKGDQCA